MVRNIEYRQPSFKEYQMKLFLPVLFILLSAAAYPQQKPASFDFDNLEVSVVDIANTGSSVEENKPGVYTVTYNEKSNSYILMISLYAKTAEVSDVKKMNSLLLKNGTKLLAQAEEKELSIEYIRNKSETIGAYYTLTDKKPEPGEYKYIIQGYVLYNYLASNFTFLCNKKEDLQVFKNIKVESLVKDRQVIKKTKHFEKVKFTEKDITAYKLQYVRHFYSRQQVIFYNNTDIYESVLPKLEEKYTQSICTDNEEGTVFFYYFADNLDSKSESFLKGLFYGAEGVPSQDNPEQFLIKDNMLIVFSYQYKSKVIDALKAAVSGKLK